MQGPLSKTAHESHLISRPPLQERFLIVGGEEFESFPRYENSEGRLKPVSSEWFMGQTGSITLSQDLAELTVYNSLHPYYVFALSFY